MVVLHASLADALFHGDAGEIGNFLAQASEAIEKRRFAGVRRSDDGHHVRARIFRKRGRRLGYRTSGAVVAIAHKVEAFPAGLDGRRMRCDAVSRRSATSEPSTR